MQRPGVVTCLLPIIKYNAFLHFSKSHMVVNEYMHIINEDYEKKIRTFILVACVAVFGFALSAKREPSISFFASNFL